MNLLFLGKITLFTYIKYGIIMDQDESEDV